MKRLGKSTKKGFTLVELIVVLVILAVLAAMLVPALVGYIDKAKKEKEYQTAATIYGAAQAVITEKYATDDLGTATSIKKDDFKEADADGNDVDEVILLAGLDNSSVKGYMFYFNTNHVIANDATAKIAGYVDIGDVRYQLKVDSGKPSWEPTTIPDGTYTT